MILLADFLQDYFVCDGDVAWDADYVDFVHINSEGHRVLDHSKLDLIKMTQVRSSVTLVGRLVNVGTSVMQVLCSKSVK